MTVQYITKKLEAGPVVIQVQYEETTPPPEEGGEEGGEGVSGPPVGGETGGGEGVTPVPPPEKKIPSWLIAIPIIGGLALAIYGVMRK